MSDLSSLFAPERVAVIGATDREGSVGRALMENLSSFEGEVVSENPNRETVLGETCYPRIDAEPDAPSIDLAVVETIQRISQLGTDFPAITELDVDPLVVAPDGVYAIDLRLSVDREALSTS